MYQTAPPTTTTHSHACSGWGVLLKGWDGAALEPPTLQLLDDQQYIFQFIEHFTTGTVYFVVLWLRNVLCLEKIFETFVFIAPCLQDLLNTEQVGTVVYMYWIRCAYRTCRTHCSVSSGSSREVYSLSSHMNQLDILLNHWDLSQSSQLLSCIWSLRLPKKKKIGLCLNIVF